MQHHIFLSPHLDDVVLSCGGLLASLTDRGEPAMVLSIFTGQPPIDRPLSPFAKLLHQLWGNPPQAYHIRRTEDAAALAQFGLKPHWLDMPDCIYRGDPAAGIWYYPDDTALFGDIHPAEQNFSSQIAARIQTFLQQTIADDAPRTFYVPLAVGNHVDHQLTNRAAARLRHLADTIIFYEDYPYIQRQPNDIARAKLACEAAWGDKVAWHAERASFSLQQLQTKLDAIAAYRSQLDILFGGEAAMRHDVSAFYNADDNPAETFWKKVT